MKLAFFSAFVLLLSSVPAQSIFARRGNNESAGNVSDAAAGGGNAGNPQTSLTLDPKVIAPGFANNGQGNPTPGQVPSLTSTNNFINFCLTTNQPITNGKQISGGSCNPTPMGSIPSVNNMPSCKFVFPNPKNNVIPADKTFQIELSVENLETGNFVNADTNYYAAPQQLDGNGLIIGHSHVVVQQLSSIDQTNPLDPQKFAFFKGLNDAAQGGILTADVTNGLPPGAYRLCSINTAANHQPVLAPVAQHGSMDDCVYFTAVAGGAANGNGNNSNTESAAGATGAATATNVDPAKPTNTNAETNNIGAGGGKKQKGKRRFAREIA